MAKKLVLNRFILFVTLTTSVLFVGCNKDSEPDKKEYEKVLSLNSETIKQFLLQSGQSQLAQMVKYSVDIYTYNYKVTYKDKPLTLSGIICVPVSIGNEFPVLSFQNGTITANSEAPSISYNSLQSIAIEGLAGLGYFMVIPDKIGFGSSSDVFHPFLIKEHNVMAVTEMLGAIKELPDGELSGSSPNDSLFLLGYSHGGWVTMAAVKELESNNPNNWILIAAGCGAGPYKPKQVMEYALSSETYGKPYYMSFVILSFLNEGVIANSMTDFYNEPYAGKISDLFDGINTGGQIDAQLTQINADLYTDEFLKNYPNGNYENLQKALVENEIQAWLNKTPIMLTHGQNDAYIPILVSESMYLNFLSIGSENVEYLPIPLTDHISAAIPSIASSLVWFQTFK
jgi:pimeloyl-ACP methyl ester carboxylesterase